MAATFHTICRRQRRERLATGRNAVNADSIFPAEAPKTPRQDMNAKGDNEKCSNNCNQPNRAKKRFQHRFSTCFALALTRLVRVRLRHKITMVSQYKSLFRITSQRLGIITCHRFYRTVGTSSGRTNMNSLRSRKTLSSTFTPWIQSSYTVTFLGRVRSCKQNLISSTLVSCYVNNPRVSHSVNTNGTLLQEFWHETRQEMYVLHWGAFV
jgi:hypothetical protein